MDTIKACTKPLTQLTGTDTVQAGIMPLTQLTVTDTVQTGATPLTPQLTVLLILQKKP